MNASPTYYLAFSSSIFVFCKWLYRLERALDVEIELFLFRRDSYAREWRTTAALALVRHKQASKRHSGARHAHAIRIYVAYTLIYAYMRVS